MNGNGKKGRKGSEGGADPRTDDHDQDDLKLGSNEAGGSLMGA